MSSKATLCHIFPGPYILNAGHAVGAWSVVLTDGLVGNFLCAAPWTLRDVPGLLRELGRGSDPIRKEVNSVPGTEKDSSWRHWGSRCGPRLGCWSWV